MCICVCICVCLCMLVKIVENLKVTLAFHNQIPPCFFSTAYLENHTKVKILCPRKHNCALVTFMFQEVVRGLLIVLAAIITAAKVSKHYWNVLFPPSEFLHQLLPPHPPMRLPAVCFYRSVCRSDKEGVLANMFPLHRMEQLI